MLQNSGLKTLYNDVSLNTCQKWPETTWRSKEKSWVKQISCLIFYLIFQTSLCKQCFYFSYFTLPTIDRLIKLQNEGLLNMCQNCPETTWRKRRRKAKSGGRKPCPVVILRTIGVRISSRPLFFPRELESCSFRKRIRPNLWPHLAT